MHDNDREHQMDDETPNRAEDAEARTSQAPAIRLLANPRRIRRA